MMELGEDDLLKELKIEKSLKDGRNSKIATDLEV
jgi:hypothetical protein